jgi:TPR repeat protein
MASKEKVGTSASASALVGSILLALSQVVGATPLPQGQVLDHLDRSAVLAANRMCSLEQPSSSHLGPVAKPTVELAAARLFRTGRMAVASDAEKAYKLISLAAQCWHLEANLVAAQMAESGQGVQQSKQAALDWYLRAADQGSAEGKFQALRLLASSEGLQAPPGTVRRLMGV